MKKYNNAGSGTDELGLGMLAGCLKRAAVIVGILFVALVALRLLNVI